MAMTADEIRVSLSQARMDRDRCDGVVDRLRAEMDHAVLRRASANRLVVAYQYLLEQLDGVQPDGPAVDPRHADSDGIPY